MFGLSLYRPLSQPYSILPDRHIWFKLMCVYYHIVVDVVKAL